MTSRATIMLMTLVLTSVACDDPVRVVAPDGDPTVIDAIPIVIDPERCVLFDLVSEPATIEHLGLTGDLLTVTVRYSGGCADHTFTLHTGECFLESWPPQSEIFLVHEDPDDPCDAVVTEERVFDLTPLREVYWEVQGGRSRTLLLNLHEPGNQEHYEPQPHYEFESR